MLISIKSIRMAKISKKDIFDDSFFTALDKAQKELLQTLEVFKKLGKEARDVTKGIKTATTFNQVTKAAKAASDSVNKLTDAEKKLLKANKDLAFQRSKEGKKLAEINELKRRAAKANRDMAKSQDGAAKSTNRWGKAVGSFAFKFNALGNIMANVVSFISRQFRKAITSAINVITGFEQAMADVRAITGATNEEFKQLSKSARDLGGSTKFTAVQVAELQKEYAKLGFTTQEIINAQKATLDLAAATKTDLARAAEVVGITIRQFSLNAKEATRVTDVMARSFTSSALDTEKFAEAMKFVGPAAKASNVSLERTTAILGQLADAGISGSMAGTSLRQIMLALSKESGTFSEKIERAAESGLDLAGAAEEVQKRAATALLVLADGIGTIDEFTEALENAAGAAEEMARIQLATLKGQITILKSAWQRYILSLAQSEEQFELLKAILQGTSSDLNSMADNVEANKEEATGLNKVLRNLWQGIQLGIPILGQQKVQWGEVTAVLREAKLASDETGLSIEELLGGFKEFGEFMASEAGKFWEQLFPKAAEEPPIIETLETLGEELKTLREIQKTASIEQIGAINLEIAAIEKKIQKFKDAGKISKDMLKLLEELRLEAGGFFKDEDQQAVIFPPDVVQTTSDTVDAIFETIQQANSDRTDNEIETADKILAINSQLAIDLAGIEEEKRELVKQTGTELFNFFATLNDRKIALIDDQIAKEIGSEQALQKEKTRLLRKNAIIEKANALFNIAINTAVGVSAALKTPALIPFIIALGLSQAAVVLARPIPQFAKGVKSSPEGPAIIGERGSELLIDKQGHVGLSPSVPTLSFLEKGTEVVPADITSQLLKYTHVINGSGTAEDSIVMAVMDRLEGAIEGLKREIRNKPVSGAYITPAGILTATYKGNTTIKKLDKFFT